MLAEVLLTVALHKKPDPYHHTYHGPLPNTPTWCLDTMKLDLRECTTYHPGDSECTKEAERMYEECLKAQE